MVALVLACLTLMTLDHHPGAHSPARARAARGGLGVRAGRVGHLAGGPPGDRGRRLVPHPQLHAERHRPPPGAELPAPRPERHRRLPRNQLAEFQGLTSAAGTLGQALVPAHVVAYGPAQSFSRTVTVDAGLGGRRTTRPDGAQRRRPGRPGAPGDADHRDRAADRRHRVGRRRPGRHRHEGRLPRAARAGSATTAASTSSWSTRARRRPRATPSSPGAARAARRTSPGCRSAA